MDDVLDPGVQGVIAAKAGLSIEENPYRADLELLFWKCWRAGYILAFGEIDDDVCGVVEY